MRPARFLRLQLSFTLDGQWLETVIWQCYKLPFAIHCQYRNRHKNLSICSTYKNISKTLNIYATSWEKSLWLLISEITILIGLVAPRDDVTSMLQQLHWLPVQYRITYKLCLPMHLIHTSQAPSYLTDIVTQTASASVTSRTRLRSGSSLRYEQPRTRLKRRKTSVFLRCTSCVEQSATVTSRTTVYLTLRHSNET